MQTQTKAKEKAGHTYTVEQFLALPEWAQHRILNLAAELAETKAQRDLLREALEYLIQGRPGEAQFDPLYDVRVKAARAAIAKVTEGQS